MSSRGARRHGLALLSGLGTLLFVLPGGSSGGNRHSLAADSARTHDPPRFVQQKGLGEGGSVALSMDGNTAIVGRRGANAGRGEALIFRRSGLRAAWRELAELRVADKKVSFGSSVAVSADGRTALVGAPGVDEGKGAAWFFTPRGGGVSVGQKLTGRGRAGAAGFGRDVAFSSDGKTALVGGPDDGGKGAVWVFMRSGTSWKQQGEKLVAKGLTRGARFGESVALSSDGNVALIGAPLHRTGQGAAWVFTRKGARSTWQERATLQIKPVLLKPTQKDWIHFGRSVALSAGGQTALVGGPFYKERKGGAFLFTGVRSGSPESRGQLGPSATPIKPRSFGLSVALAANGRTALIGGNQTWVFSRASHPYWETQSLRGGSAAVSGDGQTALINTSATANPRGETLIFVLPPVVTAVQPAFGPSGGGTDVTITGRRFTRVRSVWFGSKPAASFAVSSPTQVRAVSPAGQAGDEEVTVTTSVGTSTPGSFRYYARPVVTAISPASGPIAGGTEVTITGIGLTLGGAVRFGAVAATSISGTFSSTQIRVLSPPGQPGTVDVTVTTPGGTSATNAAARFTYFAPLEKVIDFDDLKTGGLQGGGQLVVVNSQYTGQGVTFNNVSAIDYAKGSSAIPGFARSGTVGIERCVGIEFCTTPIRATFSAPKTMVRVWVGFSFPLNQSVQVQLRAYAGSAVVGTANATLPARGSPTPISVPLEVRLATASIMQLEVSIPGGFNNALAVDDVTFEGP